MHRPNGSSRSASVNSSCRTCGSPLVERVKERGEGKVRFCGSVSCPMYGVPSFHRGRASVTINDQGEVVGSGA